MRILIAPDKFKGSLDASAAASAIAAGFQRVIPDASLAIHPIADGGEGTAAAFHQSLGGEWITVSTVDALERPLQAEYLWLAERQLAVLDMSSASGLAQLSIHERNPLRTSTRGTGLMALDAIQRGAKTLYVGLGGSATNDAGCGFAYALGWKFRDTDGNELAPCPTALQSLSRIEAPPAFDVEMIGICDVNHPLLGEQGCSASFGPQKGACPADVPILDQTLKRVADLIETQLGKTFRHCPGAGAAGGLGFGLLAFGAGRLEPGFAVISELLDLPTRVAEADWVFTGEGKLDAQSLRGKGPGGLAQLAQQAGKPIGAFAGRIEDAEQLRETFDWLIPLADPAKSLEESLTNARKLLTLAAERAARRIFQDPSPEKAGDCHPAPFSG